VSSATPGSLNINLGCGARWKSTWSNLDGGTRAKRLWLRAMRVLAAVPIVNRLRPAKLRQYPPDVVIWDMLRTPLPYPTASADVIFSQYSFEYMKQGPLQAILRDCRRILKPGGLIRLCQVDIAGIVERYRAEDVGPSPRALARAREFLESLGGEHTKLSVRLLHGGGHQQLFDAPTLEWMLGEAGFTDIRFVGFHEGACPDLDVLEANFDPIPLLRVEARAPHAVADGAGAPTGGSSLS
jgi:SAM-dependent methyltransferase